jgi:hypothetical protein
VWGEKGQIFFCDVLEKTSTKIPIYGGVHGTYITQKINWVKYIPFHKIALSKIMHWLTRICSFYSS